MSATSKAASSTPGVTGGSEADRDRVRATPPPGGAVTEHHRLGRSGLAVSRVGLGCNTFGARIDGDEVRAIVHAALDAGVTLFDTAEVYGSVPGESEELLGAALGGRREEAVVATKFGHTAARVAAPSWEPRGSRSAVVRAVEGSLRRLGTDRIDLLQLHEPDPATPIEETLAALDDVVRAGKVRYVGSSNFAGWQVADADRVSSQLGGVRFVSAQNHWNLLERGAEAELVPACRHYGIGILPYFPLAFGLLTGKYRRDEAPPEGSRLALPRLAGRLADADWSKIEALRKFADARGIGLLDIAIGWLAAQPVVGSVIAGARTPDQVRANVAAGRWRPTAEDLAELDRIAPASSSTRS